MPDNDPAPDPNAPHGDPDARAGDAPPPDPAPAPRLPYPPPDPTGIPEGFIVRSTYDRHGRLLSVEHLYAPDPQQFRHWPACRGFRSLPN